VITITMIKNAPVALDGINVELFEEGKDYSLPDDVANNLIEGKLARTKSIVSYENKSFDGGSEKVSVPDKKNLKK
jgi:hypothetical protein